MNDRSHNQRVVAFNLRKKLPGMCHSCLASFLDTVTMAPESDWNTANESDDQFAKRVARDDALDHLDTFLKAP